MMVDALTLGFVRNHPADAARVLEPLGETDVAAFLSRLSPPDAALVLNRLAPQNAAGCLAAMPLDQSAAIVGLLAADIAAILIRRLDSGARQKLLAAVQPGRAAVLHMALRYPEAVVGSILDPRVLAVPEDMPVRDVIAVARNHGDTLQDHIFVINGRKELTGVVDVMQILVADRSLRIQELAGTPEHSFPARASLASVRNAAAWDTCNVVPVVDRNRLLLGTVTREAVNRALAVAGPAPQSGTEILDLLLAFAEAVWTACAEFLLRPAADRESRRSGP